MTEENQTKMKGLQAIQEKQMTEKQAFHIKALLSSNPEDIKVLKKREEEIFEKACETNSLIRNILQINYK